MGSPEGGELDLEDFSRLRSLFLACDVQGSGRIERDDFGLLCAELRVRPAEAEAIFQRLDTDRDGAITFPEFARGFRGTARRRRQQRHRDNRGETWDEEMAEEGREQDGSDAFDVLTGVAAAASAAGPSQAWREFELRLGEEAGCIPRQQCGTSGVCILLAYAPLKSLTLQACAPQGSTTLGSRCLGSGAKAPTGKKGWPQPALQPVVPDSAGPWQKEEGQSIQSPASLPGQEQVSVLYQNISIVEPRLIQPYEHVIKNFIREIKLQSAEMENLAIAVKRAQDKAAMQLSELEEEMDQRIQAAEHKIKKEEKRKAEEALSDLKQQYEAEVDDLQVTIKKLKMENHKLKKDLMEAQTNIAFLQSELDTLKSDLADQSLNSERSSHSSYVDEDCDSLALCDPMQRINCEVDSLPESCFDSGLSTLRDSNEYDSELESKHQRISQRSQGPQESFAGDASDTDVPDIRDEEVYSPDEVSTVLDWKPCQPISQSSSGASTRKYISAISPQPDSIDCSSRYPSSEKAYKIVLAGDAAVGKSSFLLRLCKNEFRGNTSATLGVDFQMKRLIVDGEPTVLQLWDTAGQERFRSIAKSYFRRADGVLLLYDVTCEKSFLNVREWIDMIEDATHENIPIMVVGNKADLRPVAYEQGDKCVPVNYGEKLAMAYNALFCETSAKDGSNIVEAVLHLARYVEMH
ncbi:UNVERIFIED_CONTAM: hypothetical protein K2H54_048901 [Gekko kuhli]